MTEVRDWQKDMELIEQYEHAKTLVHGWIPQAHGQDVPKEPVEEVLKYWLQQYAAEKERADKAKELLWDALGSLVLIAGPNNQHVKRIRDGIRSIYPLEKEEEAK
ncbi:hypothetical protein [Paenibacillus macerans]|uniref:hypothetical protein n=1 Tax=Paenibacillus macerans TaxID=44252 RepID=UPI00203AA395|nr:hypothetical protein [Paenibacillus macerans]MCM3701453.1 hypothetical protein [Paenibacillus macerans]